MITLKIALPLLLGLLSLGCSSQRVTEVQTIAVEEGIRRVNGVELYYKAMGTGPPIVVLHGGPGDSHTYFLPQLQPLAADYRLIFYDQRASGQSGGQADLAAITVDTFVADLEGIRQAFDLEQMTLLGHSWGGLLALHYALKYPERVRALILVAPAPASAAGLDQFRANLLDRMTGQDQQRLNAAFERAVSEGSPEAVAAFKSLLYSYYFYDPALSADLPPIQASPASARVAFQVNRSIWASLGDYDLHAELATLDLPTLILHCAADPVPPEGARKIHDDVAGSQFVLLEKCGHFPFVDAPEAFFDQVNRFLRQLATVRPGFKAVVLNTIDITPQSSGKAPNCVVSYP